MSGNNNGGTNTDLADKRFDDFLALRKDLIAMRSESFKSYDQALLTLSGGALGISIAFIENLTARPPVNPTLLNNSWLLLTGALLSTLISFWTSQQAIGRAIRILDKQQMDKNASTINFWSGITSFFNAVSGILFVVGIYYLISFGIENLPALRPLEGQ